MSKHEFDTTRAESLYWLAAGTAHDVNNLLMVVIGCAEMALDDHTLQPHTRDLVREIVGAGERAGLLTRQFLSVGRPAEAVSAVDMAAVLRKAELLLRRLIGAGIDLHFTPGVAPQWVHAQASQIEQVVVNLVLNARDAMATGGTLTITLCEVAAPAAANEPPGERQLVRLTVTDTGGGIDPTIQGRMYDAFATTKTTDKGSGLGLAVVRAIVDQLAGSIHMTTAPGRGTTFAIDLPKAVAPA